VKKSVNSDLSMEWLKPFMTERKCAAGEVLFYMRRPKACSTSSAADSSWSSPVSTCR